MEIRVHVAFTSPSCSDNALQSKLKCNLFAKYCCPHSHTLLWFNDDPCKTATVANLGEISLNLRDLKIVDNVLIQHFILAKERDQSITTHIKRGQMNSRLQTKAVKLCRLLKEKQNMMYKHNVLNVNCTLITTHDKHSTGGALKCRRVHFLLFPTCAKMIQKS